MEDNMNEVRQLEDEENSFEIISEIIENIAIYRSMNDVYSKYINNASFVLSMNNCAQMIIIRLCNIFGQYSEDNHYKNLNIDKNLFEKEVVLKVFKSIDEYEKYHENLTSIRSRYVVHYKKGDSKYKNEESVLTIPYFDQALELVICYLELILESKNYLGRETARSDAMKLYDLIYKETTNIFDK